MKNIEICREKRIILVNKEFYKASNEYGSEAYKELMGAQKDFPKFKVVVKTVKNKNEFKNIDIDFMVAYISAHDDEKKSIRATVIAITPRAMNTYSACMAAEIS